MSTPDSINKTLFKERMVMLRYLVENVTDEEEAEFYFRELNKLLRALVPKFRKGNDLANMIATNRLLKSGLPVLDSRSSS